MFSGGWYEQPATPASASVAPITRKNSRRLSGSISPGGWRANSRSRRRRNSGVSASCSRLRQYSRPRLPDSRRRISARSSCGGALSTLDRGMKSPPCEPFPSRASILPLRSASLTRSLPGRRSAFGVGPSERSVLDRMPNAERRRPLMVACRAIRHLEPVHHVVLHHEPLSHLLLVLRRCPAEVEHLVARADVLLRVPVTVEAPAHAERLHLPRDRHRVHPAVAGDAADPLVDVDAVVEVD